MAEDLTEYCTYFPEDAACQDLNAGEETTTDEPVVDDGAGEEVTVDMVDDVEPEGKMEDMDGGKSEEDMRIWQMMKFEKMMEWAMRDPMMGQIAYTTVAVGQAVWLGLMMFRYYGIEARVPASMGDTDYAGLAHMIGGYGGLALWSAAAITQLMSDFGAGGDLNMMVWGYGLEMGGSILGMIVSLFVFLSYNEAYTWSQDTTKTADEQATALAHMDELEAMWTATAANEAMVALTLMAEYNNWKQAQWMILSEEEQNAYKEEMKAKLEAKMAEKQGDMAAEEPAEEPAAEE